jgi:transposase
MTKRATAKPSKLGPGEYLPDPTELIQRAEDLPRPKHLKQSRNYPHRPCPRCGRAAYRDRVFQRQLHDIGDLLSGRPHEIDLVYSQHYCSTCRKYFSVDTSDLAPPGGRYTHRVMALAVRSVVEDGLAYRNSSWRLWRDHRVFVPFATIQNWVEAGGEKGD